MSYRHLGTARPKVSWSVFLPFNSYLLIPQLYPIFKGPLKIKKIQELP